MIDDFTAEDLRIMIGQKIGLKFLVPLALKKLAEDPLASGDFFPGDLLQNVLRLGRDYWKDNFDPRTAAREVVAAARVKIAQLRIEDHLFERGARELLETIAQFDRDNEGLK